MTTATLNAIFPGHVSGYWGKDAGALEKDVCVVRNGDVLGSGMIRWDQVPVRSLTASEVSKSELVAGDLLLTTSGDCARVAYVDRVERPTCASNFVRRLRADPSTAHSRYLFHLMNSERFRAQCSPHIRGTTLQNLAVSSAFDAIEIPLPPIEEQRRIAAVLDAADALRVKRRQALAKLDTLTQAAFVDMFGDPVVNPMGWSRMALGSLLDSIDSGKSPVCLDRRAEPDEWAVLKLGAVTWCEYDESQNKALPPDVEPETRHEVRPGDLLFTRKNTRELVGSAALVHTTRPRLLLSDLIFRLRIGVDAPIDATYLHQLLITPSKRREVQRLAGGSAGSMPNISKARLLSLEVELPPLEAQRRFARAAASARREGLSARRSSRQFDRLFASLQQRAFRGEL